MYAIQWNKLAAGVRLHAFETAFGCIVNLFNDKFTSGSYQD